MELVLVSRTAPLDVVALAGEGVRGVAHVSAVEPFLTGRLGGGVGP